MALRVLSVFQATYRRLEIILLRYYAELLAAVICHTKIDLYVNLSYDIPEKWIFGGIELRIVGILTSILIVGMLWSVPVLSEPVTESGITRPESTARGWITIDQIRNDEIVHSFGFRVLVGEFQEISFNLDGESFAFYVFGFPISKILSTPVLDGNSIWFGGMDHTDPTNGMNTPKTTIWVYVKQVSEDTKWILTTESGEKIELKKADISSGKIGYLINMKLDGQWYKDAYAECLPNAHMEFGYGNDPDFVIIGPGDTWDSVSEEFKNRVYVKVPIPPEFGEFYGIARAVGEVWTVTINGVAYSASVTEADPDFDIQGFMSCQIKPKWMEAEE